MKKNIINIIILFIFLLFKSISGYSQKIILNKTDTFIIIKPKDVTILNCIVSDLERSKKLLNIKDSIINNNISIINKLDSLLIIKENITRNQEFIYNNKIDTLEKSIKNEKKKKVRNSIILGGISTILGILLIIK